MNTFSEQAHINLVRNIKRTSEVSEIINLIHQERWVSHTKSGHLINLEDRNMDHGHIQNQAIKLVNHYAKKSMNA